jgi:hypothetical protein
VASNPNFDATFHDRWLLVEPSSAFGISGQAWMKRAASGMIDTMRSLTQLAQDGPWRRVIEDALIGTLLVAVAAIAALTDYLSS